MSFPERIQQHKNEDKSFAIIKKDLIELGVFRDQTSYDYGIDFEIEIENNGRMEGHCLKVQVKSSDDLNIRNDGHATVGGIICQGDRYLFYDEWLMVNGNTGSWQYWFMVNGKFTVNS